MFKVLSFFLMHMDEDHRHIEDSNYFVIFVPSTPILYLFITLRLYLVIPIDTWSICSLSDLSAK